MVTIRRIGLAVLKVLICVLTVYFLAKGIYYGITELSLAENRAQKTQNSIAAGEQEDVGDRIAVVVGTASVLMAVWTMLQQHISRHQDRALAFPKMILSQCQFYIGEDAVEENTSFYNDRGGELLIKINFQESFSSCYVPRIYRVRCAKDCYETTYTKCPEFLCKLFKIRAVKKKYERLKILKYFSSLKKEELCMEAVIEKPGLIGQYRNKMCGTRDYKLDLVVDVCWRNELLMYGLRNMANMYLRYEIRLDDSQRVKCGENNGATFKVENVNMKGAPLW